MCIFICIFQSKLWMVTYVQTFDHTSIMPLWTNHLRMLTGHNFGQMQEFLPSPMLCHPLFFHKHHQPLRVVVIFKLRDWELVSRDDNGHHTRILPFDWEIPTPSLPIIAAFVWEISRCDFYHFFGELFHSTLFPEFRDFTNVEFVIQFSTNIHCDMELSNLWLFMRHSFKPTQVKIAIDA